MYLLDKFLNGFVFFMEKGECITYHYVPLQNVALKRNKTLYQQQTEKQN